MEEESTNVHCNKLSELQNDHVHSDLTFIVLARLRHASHTAALSLKLLDVSCGSGTI